MVKIGIVGGTGYTGVELLRLLASHEQVAVEAITSRAESGRRVDELFPNLRGHYELAFSEPEVAKLAACDVVFFATPHGVAHALAGFSNPAVITVWAMFILSAGLSATGVADLLGRQVLRLAVTVRVRVIGRPPRHADRKEAE